MASGSRDIKIRFTSDTEGLEQASSDAQSSFKGVSRSSERVSKSMGRTGKASKSMGTRMDRVGKAGDNLDEKASGLRHGFMGVQDTFMGVSKVSEGDLMPGLIGLGSGIGDLGQSIHRGIIPSFQAMGERMSGLKQRAGGLRGSLKKVGKRAGLIGIAVGGATAGFSALAEAFGETEPKADSLATDFRKLNRTGETSGDLMKVVGADAGAFQRNLANLSNAGGKAQAAIEGMIPGLDKIPDPLGQTGVGLSNFKKKLGDVDDALTEMPADESKEAFDNLTESLGLNDKQVGHLKDHLPGFSSQQKKVKEDAKDTAKALDDQVTAMKEATDPMFALNSALKKVDQAHENYNDAVDKYGKKSDEAKSASFDVAQAVAGAEAAAKDGDLSFGEFKGQLDEWVRQGTITEGEAANIRDRVYEARREGDKYSGERNLTLTLTDYASQAIESITTNLSTMGGGLLDPGLSGTRASGGPVSRGTSYLVGEQGPELFTPGASGNITPNDKLAAGGGGGGDMRGEVAAGVADALASTKFTVDGHGMASLVNQKNKRNERRRATG